MDEPGTIKIKATQQNGQYKISIKTDFDGWEAIKSLLESGGIYVEAKRVYGRVKEEQAR